jgi:hypothetical protein
MSRRAVLVASLLALLVPAASWATFHLARIHEVMSGVGGVGGNQFVEIQMTTTLQNSVANTRLTWFNCNFTSCKVLMQVPFNVANSGALPWLMGAPNDATFFAATGEHAEYYWDSTAPGMSIDRTCGMVCWGAPDSVVPNPLTWDPGEPNNYTDCVAYGGYTGRTKTVAAYVGGPTSGTPDTEMAGDGTTMSLTRVTDTNNNLTDFQLAAMSPTSNGPPNLPTQTSDPCTQAANNCPCTPTAPQDHVETNIFLVKNPSDASARKVLWLVKEAAPNDDMVNGNPVTSGATLKLKLDAVTQCFNMPSGGWSTVDLIGFKYSDPTGANGPIKKAQIKRTPAGVFQIKVIILGKNGAVNIVPPNPGTQGDMNFHINVGDQYCGSTAGGVLNPNDAVTFKAKGAPAPGACNVTFCP